MAFNQPKTNFLLVLLAIVATQCLARSTQSKEETRSFLRELKRDYGLSKRLMFAQRKVRSFLF